jgi:mannose-6-phosphate isomerase-like protein (cupin superfamily)
MKKVNLAAKFAQFEELWSPRIVGELNGQQVKIAKLQGDFVWHHHDDADELFYVFEGELLIRSALGDITLHAGEFLIVPRGVEHQPVAEREAHVLIFEPQGTRNTGNVRNERTHEDLEAL